MSVQSRHIVEEDTTFASLDILRGIEKYCKPFSMKDHPSSVLFNLDCNEGMRYFPSNYFDLAIVDPEYGIDVANMTMGKGKNKKYSKKKSGIKNHPIKNISMNYSGFPKIRLFGVETISQTNCMYREVGLFGIKC